MADSLGIETVELKKSYDGVDALCGLDLAIPAGSICGFVGRNGSGKTTTIKLLLGMARPTSGQVRVFGLPADVPSASVEIRRRIGFVAEDKDLYGYMTVEAIIGFTASFYPRWRADLQKHYLRTFDLPLQRTVKTLSHGTRAKLALLLAFCRGAELLILDEPTSGLDPASTEEVLQALVSHVASEEMTVFFSSHQIADVDQIADHIAMIHRGRTVLTGGLDELRGGFRRIQLTFSDEAPQAAFRAPGVVQLRRSGRVLSVLASSGVDALVAEARVLGPVAIDVFPVTLKEIFLGTVVEQP